MVLTSRDRKIIIDLQSYGLFSTRKIAARYFPDVAMTTVLRRLRCLERNGFIQRISGLEGGSFAWGLTKKAVEEFHFTSAKVHFPRFILDHDLKLSDLRLRLEGQGIAQSWRPEQDIRAHAARKHGLKLMTQNVIPDGLMGVEVGGLRETVAVELELFAKNQSRYKCIFDDYGKKKNIWGFWYVVAKPTIGKQLQKAAKDSWHVGNRPYFLWSVLSEVMNDPMSANVHGYKDTFRLRDLWRITFEATRSEPAHPPAQGVSRENNEINVDEPDLTAEIEKGKIAPS